MLRVMLTNKVSAHLVRVAHGLPSWGTLKCIGQYTYLDISDNYIHDLYPLVGLVEFEKPDYFSQEQVGAHISVIYPEEKIPIASYDLGTRHEFIIIDTFVKCIGEKEYLGLRILSHSLTALRKRYGLSEKLCFKNVLVDFHITVAVKKHQDKGAM